MLLAGWGDLLAGVLAVAAALVATRLAYWVFHVIGAADFVVAVGTGLALTLASDSLMGNNATFPVALIPLSGVGLSGASHVVAFHLLLKTRTPTKPERAVEPSEEQAQPPDRPRSAKR